jgi:hypothetical protein
LNNQKQKAYEKRLVISFKYSGPDIDINAQNRFSARYVHFGLRGDYLSYTLFFSNGLGKSDYSNGISPPQPPASARSFFRPCDNFVCLATDIEYNL